MISRKEVTVSGITANNKPFDGNTVATLNFGSATLVGVIPPDNVTLNTVGATGAFATAAVGGPKVVTIAGLTLGGADAGNYSLTQPTAMASITAWSLSGFLQPVGIPNTYPGMPSVTTNTLWNTIKGGQTVPLKFKHLHECRRDRADQRHRCKATGFRAGRPAVCTGPGGSGRSGLHCDRRHDTPLRRHAVHSELADAEGREPVLPDHDDGARRLAADRILQDEVVNRRRGEPMVRLAQCGGYLA